MISEKTIEKYRLLGSDELNSTFENAVKDSKHEVVKLFMDNFYSRIYLDKVTYSLFRSCINDDTRMFKYFMFKQNKFDFNITAYWNESLVNSCGGASGTKMLEFILKSPLSKCSFSHELFYTAFLNTNLNSLKLLIEKGKINIHDIAYKNDSEYLNKLIRYSRKDAIEYLAYKHEINFVMFKDIALVLAEKDQYNADKILEIINKQELFFKLKNSLIDQEKSVKVHKL